MAEVLQRLVSDVTMQSMLTQITRHNDLMTQLTGTLSQLTTDNKTSLVAAVNELVSKTGALSALETESSMNLVAAINEVAAAAKGLSEGNGAGLHNSIYRGKYLGNELTPEQSAAIQAGTFDDLWIGDYWTINGIKYLIADFDYYLHKGNTELTEHHAVIIPEKTMYNARMEASGITTNGYAGSEMYTTNLSQARTTIRAAFPDHVLTHKNMFSSASSNGRVSATNWYDSEADLMSEAQVYGTYVFESGSADGGNTIPYRYTLDYTQFNLFRLRPDLIVAFNASGNRENWWLRDVVSASYFAFVNAYGSAAYHVASYPLGVRPAFLIH